MRIDTRISGPAARRRLRFAAVLAPLALLGAADPGSSSPPYDLEDGTRRWFTQSREAVELAEAERWAEAARAFEAVLDRHPDNAYAAGRAARSWLEAGDHERALAAYRRAYEFHFQALPAMFGVARSCAALDRRDCAFEWLDRFRSQAWLDLSTLLDTDELRRLRSDPRHAALVEEIQRSLPPPPTSRFAWSPDGARLLYHTRIRPERGWQFHVTHVESGETAQVGQFDNEIVAGFDWSPDGEWIVFSRYRATPWTDNLYLMRPDGTDLRPLLEPVDGDGDGIPNPPAGRDMGPSWSHDGKRIAFVRADSEDGYQVYTVRRDGTGLERITNTPHYKENPRFTTGDRRVCYDVPPVDEPDGESDYYVYCVPAAGGEPKLLRGEGWWYNAVWAARANVYAATYWHSNNSRFGRAVLVDGASGEVTVLTPPDVDALHAAPSPDGSWVGFGASRHGFGDHRCLFVIRADGTGMRPVGPLGNCLEE